MADENEPASPEPRPRPARVTQAMVARRAGVSVSTVSLVLSGRTGTRITSTTAADVRRAAADLGYSPNTEARSLRTGRSRTIGFLSDEVTVTRYASAMIRGLLDEGSRSDYALLMAEHGTEPESLTRSFDALLARPVEALVAGLMQARELELPRPRREMPLVMVNGRAPGYASILPDEFNAGREAVRRLVAAGHRRIALIGRSRRHLDPAFSVTVPHRFAGLDSAMSHAGLRWAGEFHGTVWEPDLGYRGTLALLADTDATAVVAANDRVALGVYQAAQEAGRRIPADLSVISFDDEQIAPYLRPGITTMRLPYLEMGGAAMRLAIELVSGAEQPDADAPVLLPMPLIERGSIASL